VVKLYFVIPFARRLSRAKSAEIGDFVRAGKMRVGCFMSLTKMERYLLRFTIEFPEGDKRFFIAITTCSLMPNFFLGRRWISVNLIFSPEQFAWGCFLLLKNAG
jgi:hypothetical protein